MCVRVWNDSINEFHFDSFTLRPSRKERGVLLITTISLFAPLFVFAAFFPILLCFFY